MAMSDLISRQAAVDKLNEGLDKIPVINNTMIPMIRRDERISCIHELQSLPSAKREYKYGEWCTNCKEYDQERHCCPRFNAVIRTAIDDIIADRKKGEWINHRNDNGHNIADCSECGNAIQWFDDDEKPKFCCMCGADMREREEE